MSKGGKSHWARLNDPRQPLGKSWRFLKMPLPRRCNEKGFKLECKESKQGHVMQCVCVVYVFFFMCQDILRIRV